MKLLIVGSNKIEAIENAYVEHLKDKCEINFFNAHGTFLDYYHKNLFNKLVYRTGLSTILNKINATLLKEINKIKPDVIWVFKGMEIFPKTLKKIKELGITLVNYNADHPFEYMSKGSGNKNVFEGIKYYHHHFSYSQQIVERIKKEYSISSSWLPFGYFTAIPPPVNRETIKNKICFIGNPDKERAKIIDLLLEHDIPVDVYGNGWNKFITSNKNLTIFGPVYTKEFNTTAQKYRIQLNVFRPHNIGSHNMRTFEMPALGCIMLAPSSKEHLELFGNGKEAFYYENEIDLIEKCTYIMTLFVSEVKTIQMNAYNRSISSNYSYKDRAAQVLKIVAKIKND
ncbi:MAG: hypothetical protein COA97_06690 [Flavobacteriales bacterium]|nr:MAG: hypothetical protein COA97_06690 [Flavobacteriales bacterium]